MSVSRQGTTANSVTLFKTPNPSKLLWSFIEWGGGDDFCHWSFPILGHASDKRP